MLQVKTLGGTHFIDTAHIFDVSQFEEIKINKQLAYSFQIVFIFGQKLQFAVDDLTYAYELQAQLNEVVRENGYNG